LTKLETQIKQGKDTRLGVVYVGRIPHKIQEKDLKVYFGQFGTIAHTRIARNPLTGRSRHYAFVQYKSQEVADIVVETMDNHLFGGRLLKVKSVPKDKVHPMLFTGERTKVSEEHNRKRTQSKITKQKDAKLTPYVKKRIESEMEKTQKAIKESGINYEVPKKLLAKKTNKPMIETKKAKAKTN
jgi:nucleolar protein 15